MPNDLEKAKDLIVRYQLRELLERVRRTHVADMVANDMSDPQEPLDPYFVSPIGLSYLPNIRALYKQTFPTSLLSMSTHFRADYMDVMGYNEHDAAGSTVVETNSPTRATLIAELLSFAACISKG
jgi:hypothetical protein